MGAAIRHVSDQLDKQGSRKRLLMILTDGKPNDVDHYEGRFALEDCRRAVIEARGRGQAVLCRDRRSERARLSSRHIRVSGLRAYLEQREAAERATCDLSESDRMTALSQRGR